MANLRRPQNGQRLAGPILVEIDRVDEPVELLVVVVVFVVVVVVVVVVALR